MSEVIDSEVIVHELRAIRDDLDFIKRHMVDVDSIMTEEDNLFLNEFRTDKNAGKLISHEELKRELGL
jgi:transposase-like protein